MRKQERVNNLLHFRKLVELYYVLKHCCSLTLYVTSQRLFGLNSLGYPWIVDCLLSCGALERIQLEKALYEVTRLRRNALPNLFTKIELPLAYLVHQSVLVHIIEGEGSSE